MSVWQLIEAMDRVVHPGAPAGTRWRASARVRSATAEHEVTVAARVDPQGRRREQYFCDGVRLDRALLLRLTCTDAECPEARAVRERWDGFHGRAPRKPLPAPALRAQPLMQEHAVEAGPHRCVARPARFACHTPCPNKAHPPMTIDRAGWDLFDDGLCIAGGTVVDAGAVRPRLRTLQEAEAFLLAHWLFARAAFEALQKGGA